MNAITVYFNGRGMLISKTFADLKGIKEGYMILSQKEFHEIFLGHVEHEKCQLKMLIQAKKNVN
jgi:hypothetical protein